MLTKATMGGVTNHIIDLGNRIQDSDSENRVFVGCDDNEATNQLKNHLKTYVIDFYCKNPIKVVKSFIKLKEIIKGESIDIVHCHYRIPALYMKILSYFLDVKFIWTNHLVPIPYDFFHRKTTFYGEKAIAISLESLELLISKLKIPEKDVRLMYHGINLDEFRNTMENRNYKKTFGIDDQSKVVVLLGRLEAVKGHKFLVDAVKEMENIVLLFTGEGKEEYKKELETYIVESGLEGKVIFTGFVKANEILSIADVMVLPSQREGFPISVLESFAMKVPVVRTKTAGYEDVKDLCIGVDYGNANMLKLAIEEALDREKIQPMVERAYQKVQNEWNVVQMTKNYIKLYKECINN